MIITFFDCSCRFLRLLIRSNKKHERSSHSCLLTRNSNNNFITRRIFSISLKIFSSTLLLLFYDNFFFPDNVILLSCIQLWKLNNFFFAMTTLPLSSEHFKFSFSFLFSCTKIDLPSPIQLFSEVSTP